MTSSSGISAAWDSAGWLSGASPSSALGDAPLPVQAVAKITIANGTAKSRRCFKVPPPWPRR
jgi:hypothetical protein